MMEKITLHYESIIPLTKLMKYHPFSCKRIVLMKITAHTIT